MELTYQQYRILLVHGRMNDDLRQELVAFW